MRKEDSFEEKTLCWLCVRELEKKTAKMEVVNKLMGRSVYVLKEDKGNGALKRRFCCQLSGTLE